MADTAELPHDSDLTPESSAALEIVRLIDGFKRVFPGSSRPVEPQVMALLARRAASAGFGADLMQLVRQSISAGEQDRRKAEAGSARDGADAMPIPTTSEIGHA